MVESFGALGKNGGKYQTGENAVMSFSFTCLVVILLWKWKAQRWRRREKLGELFTKKGKLNLNGDLNAQSKREYEMSETRKCTGEKNKTSS